MKGQAVHVYTFSENKSNQCKSTLVGGYVIYFCRQVSPFGLPYFLILMVYLYTYGVCFIEDMHHAFPYRRGRPSIKWAPVVLTVIHLSIFCGSWVRTRLQIVSSTGRQRMCTRVLIPVSVWVIKLSAVNRRENQVSKCEKNIFTGFFWDG